MNGTTTRSSSTKSCVLPPQLARKVQTKPSASSLAEAGDWFEAKTSFACAAAEYRAALRLDKTSLELMLRLAKSEMETGDIQGAEAGLRQAVQIAPKNVETHVALAGIYEREQKKEDAAHEWSAAVDVDKRSVAALDGMAKHLIAEGDYAAAVRLLHGAPESEALSVDLVQAYGKAGSLDQATATAKDALQKFPQSFPLTYSLATLLVDLGRMGEAKNAGENFAAAHPDSLDAQRLLLHLLITTYDWSSARPLAKTLLVQSPSDADFLFANGMLERDAGNFEEARSHLEKSIAIEPGNADAHYNLGLALAKLNSPKQARVELERALALGAKEPELRFQLAKIDESLGEKDEAAREMKIYRDSAEVQSKQSVAQAKAAQAEKEFEAGDAQKAAALYKEALEATPDDALLNFKLAMALDKTGDAAGEKAALEKSISADADMAIAHNQLGYLAARNGDMASAETQFREAVRAAPAYAEAWVNLAATLASERKMPEAKQAVTKALQADPDNANALQLEKDLAADTSQP